MTILEKLHAIEDRKVIYNISYRNGGVAFVFYYPEKVSHPEITEKVVIGGRTIDTEQPKNWSFEAAVEAEYDRLST
jgi:hypothetical protein